MVRPAEPIPLDSLDFAVAADTVPILAPRFSAARGAEELAAVPSEDALPKNPRNAALRSFLLPGWGQLYTGHPWRAVLFAGAEAGFFLAAHAKQQQALDLQDELQRERETFFAMLPDSVLQDPFAAEEAFSATAPALTIRGELEDVEQNREDFYAYFALSVIFAAVDAYVAAQLDPVQIGVEPAERRLRAAVRLPIGP